MYNDFYETMRLLGVSKAEAKACAKQLPSCFGSQICEETHDQVSGIESGMRQKG